MQLYTVGLHELHPDGTEVRDVHGQVEQTYTNLDILSKRPGLHRVHLHAPGAGTWRSCSGPTSPVRTRSGSKWTVTTSPPRPRWAGGWLGDRYPLCADLPNRPFLSAGAKYRFNGGSR